MVRFSPFRTIPFIRHCFSLTLAISLSLYFSYSPVSLWPAPFLSCSRWWQVIRYLQAGSRERWKRTRWALLSTTEENHPQGPAAFCLLCDREHKLESHLQLTNYPILQTRSTVSSFLRGWKICKTLLIIAPSCILVSTVLSLRSNETFQWDNF